MEKGGANTYDDFAPPFCFTISLLIPLLIPVI